MSIVYDRGMNELTPQQRNAKIKIFKVIDYLTKAKHALPNKEKVLDEDLSKIISNLLEKYQ